MTAAADRAARDGRRIGRIDVGLRTARETGRASFERGFISTTSVLFITIRPRAGWRTEEAHAAPDSRTTRRHCASIDSPTVANAIEAVRHAAARRGIRRVGPALRVSRAGDDDRLRGDLHGRQHHRRRGATSAGCCGCGKPLEAAPKPSVLVIKDIGPERSRSCHMGEVMATTAKALGAVGCVSDGGLRDVMEVRGARRFPVLLPRLRRVARQPGHLRRQRRRDRARAGRVTRAICCTAT